MEPSASEVPPVVARFREKAREEIIPRRYVAWLHVLFSAGGSLGVIGGLCTLLHGVTPSQWLTIPLALLVANVAEYLGHRFPMHHPYPGLRRVFTRHAGQHHRFFTAAAMSYEGPRDVYMVLFPPVLQLFFFGALGLPLTLLVRAVAGPIPSLLFAVSITAYYLCYELLHFYYHLSPRPWLEALPLLPFLRRHHLLHHDPVHMQRWNFNLTIPLMDLLLGTLRRS